MQFKLSAIVLAVALVTCNIVSPVTAAYLKEDDKFGHTYHNPTLAGTTLSADCFQSDGNLVDTSVDLDQCDGQLQCQFGGQYGGITLCCNCNIPGGWSDATCLDLNQCLTNTDGRLTC